MGTFDGISSPHGISPEDVDIKRILNILLFDLFVQLVAVYNLLIHTVDVILNISFFIIILSKVETMKLHVHSNTIPIIIVIVVLIFNIFNIVFEKQLPSFRFVYVQSYWVKIYFGVIWLYQLQNGLVGNDRRLQLFGYGGVGVGVGEGYKEFLPWLAHLLFMIWPNIIIFVLILIYHIILIKDISLRRLPSRWAERRKYIWVAVLVVLFKFHTASLVCHCPQIPHLGSLWVQTQEFSVSGYDLLLCFFHIQNLRLMDFSQLIKFPPFLLLQISLHFVYCSLLMFPLQLSKLGHDFAP